MSLFLSYSYIAACDKGDSRLVYSKGENTFIFAINSSNRNEVCHYMLTNATMKEIQCNSSWEQLRGRVEICSNGKVFGTVCDNRWDSYEAEVVCRQLKYHSDGK